MHRTVHEGKNISWERCYRRVQLNRSEITLEFDLGIHDNKKYATRRGTGRLLRHSLCNKQYLNYIQ